MGVIMLMRNKRKVSNFLRKKVVLILLSVLLLFTSSSCKDDSFIPTDNPLPTDEVEVGDEKQGNEQGLEGENEGEEGNEEEDEIVETEKFKARALYLTGWTVGIPENVENILILQKIQK